MAVLAVFVFGGEPCCDLGFLLALTASIGVTLPSVPVTASEYCTKEQYERDRTLIENAMNTGMLVRGPKFLRDSILVEEDMWFGMNYPQQIAFMQSFDCAMGGSSGKRLLYMDVRAGHRSKLLATWTSGALEPARERD
jgi:hypothetical protein